MAKIIAIVTAAAQPNANRVLAAAGEGDGCISIKASTIPDVPWDGEATHYYMSHQSAPEWLAAAMKGFENGDLPPLAPGNVWGENGIISAADAVEAVSAANFAFAEFTGDFTPEQQVAAALGAKGLHGLRPNPNE